jgi:integrase
MAVQANRKTKSSKPQKPYPDFPLFPHATKRWAKKIRGRFHYFGPWSDPQAALEKYNLQRDDLYAGRTPRLTGDGLTIRDLANRFLTAKRHLVDTRELSARTFADYHATCERIIEAFGKTRLVSDLAADDFLHLRTELAKTRGVVALGNEVNRVRVVFKFAHDEGLIKSPVHYGSTFKRPNRKALRAARQANGPRMFESVEIRKMLDAAGVQLKAMILLGINCGFGNNDVATLPLKALDLDAGWVKHPRPKTAVERRIPLWSETVAALRAVLATRPAAKDAANESLIFITRFGESWGKTTCDNPVSKETAKLLKSLGIERPGVNFYALRHTFETVGGESRDQVAVDAIMGHAPAADDMASVYRERISDERLKAVTDHVRTWLFGEDSEKPKKAKRTKTPRRASAS